MKKVTLTTIAIITALTLTACGNKTTESTTSSGITSSEVSRAHSLASDSTKLVDETYPTTDETEEVVEEDNTPDKVIVPSTSLEWFTVKINQASGFATKVRCENYTEPMQLGSANMVYGMTAVQTVNNYSTIKVINYNQKSNNIVEFYLNTNDSGSAQYVAQMFIRYMVNLKPDGKLTNGMASNAQYWLEHDGLTQDLDNED